MMLKKHLEEGAFFYLIFLIDNISVAIISLLYCVSLYAYLSYCSIIPIGEI